MGGKSSKTVVGYKYYVGFQMILAKCIDRIHTILVDNNKAWEGVQVGSGVININSPNLFGGDKSSDPEGGIVGAVSFQQGLDSQDPDTYLQSKLGSNIPASRGVSGLVARQIYAGNSPFLKQWSVVAERIHIDDDGNVQWYDEKAEIHSAGGDLMFNNLSLDSNIYYGPGSDAAHVFLIDGMLTTDTITFILALNGLTYSAWSRYPDDTGNSGRSWEAGYYVTTSDNVTHQFFDDYPTQSAAFYYPTQAEASTFRQTFPSNVMTGYTSYKLHFNDYIVQNNRGGLSFYIVKNGFPQSDMNPAHMIRECVLNGEWGYGYDDTDVDDTNFRAVADTLYNEEFGLSYFWDDSQTDLNDVLEKFEDHVDCAIYVDRSTLKWTIKLVRADYDPATLPVFTMDEEILEVDNFNRPAFMDLYNTEQITYSSNVGSNSPTITISNPALLLQQGVTKIQQTTYDMVCNGILASRLAQRDLLADGSPLANGTVFLTYTANTKGLHRGAVCKLTMPLHNMNQTVVRVTDISFGDGTTKKIKMSFIEDKFSLSSGSDAIIPVTPVQPGSGAVKALPVLFQQAMEVPYYLLVQQQGQQTIDSQIADDPDTGIFGIAAARPSGGLSADIYLDTGSGYSDVAKCDFCPYGKLSTDLPLPGLSGSNTFTLVDFEDLDELETNHIMLIGNEFVSGVHAGNGVFTSVVRACLDSVPEEHSAADSVLGVMNYLDSNEVDYAGGETVNLKLLTNSKGGVLDLADATAASVTFTGRAAKPYPPANVKIAAAYFPSAAAGTFAVTWVSRNRQQQTTTGVPIGFLDAAITPFANTRYSLAFYNSTGTLLVQRDNIGPTTASVVLAVTDTITMKLWTVDDIGASTYQFITTFAYTSPGSTNTITATDYTPVDNSTVIDGGQI